MFSYLCTFGEFIVRYVLVLVLYVFVSMRILNNFPIFYLKLFIIRPTVMMIWVICWHWKYYTHAQFKRTVYFSPFVYAYVSEVGGVYDVLCVGDASRRRAARDGISSIHKLYVLYARRVKVLYVCIYKKPISRCHRHRGRRRSSSCLREYLF